MNTEKRAIKRSEEYKISKFQFYRKLSFWAVIVASLASISYWISDCQLMQGISYSTLFPRLIILAPLLIFIIINRVFSDYRMLLCASYIQVHVIVLCSIWSISYLVNDTHVNEGMITLQIVFLTLGFAAPFSVATFFHLLFLVELIGGHMICHFVDFDLIMSLNIPLMIAIIAIQWVMSDLYIEHFNSASMLERLSYFDRLTDVYNRNVLQNLVEPGTQKLIPDLGENCCALIFDVDFFKKVNDEYGHPAGDKVLKFVAKLAKERLREKDYIIRWGGEEFVILLADAKIPQAFALAEEMRRTVANRDNGVCPISISVGVSQYDGKDYRTAINRADEMLYLAKTMGRNRVCVYERDATLLDYAKNEE